MEPEPERRRIPSRHMMAESSPMMSTTTTTTTAPTTPPTGVLPPQGHGNLHHQPPPPPAFISAPTTPVVTTKAATATTSAFATPPIATYTSTPITPSQQDTPFAIQQLPSPAIPPTTSNVSSPLLTPMMPPIPRRSSSSGGGASSVSSSGAGGGGGSASAVVDYFGARNGRRYSQRSQWAALQEQEEHDSRSANKTGYGTIPRRYSSQESPGALQGNDVLAGGYDDKDRRRDGSESDDGDDNYYDGGFFSRRRRRGDWHMRAGWWGDRSTPEQVGGSKRRRRSAGSILLFGLLVAFSCAVFWVFTPSFNNNNSIASSNDLQLLNHQIIMAGTGGGGSSTDKALPVQHHTPFTQLITLPFTFPPPPPPPPPPPHKPPHPPKKLVPKRLILIGDVHGAFDELVRLLEKVEFKPEEDHVILTGDLVSKGPKSGAVLDLLSHYSGLGAASCVRGNHDDRVLAAYARLHRKKKEKGKEEEEEDSSADEDYIYTGDITDYDEEDDEDHELGNRAADSPNNGDKKKKKHHHKKPHGPDHRRKRLSDLAVARTLTPQQASFLATCPLILRVHGAGEKGGDLLAVHAGIVPGVALMKQRPALLMNMRTIIPDDGKKKKKGKKGKKDGGVWGGGRPSSSTKGRHWAEVWNEFEERGGAVEVWGDGEGEGESGDGGGGGAEKRNIGDRPTTVVYGHYAAQGLDIRRWTKGLDSGCVRGGRLTALVVEGGWEADGHEEEKVYGNQMSLVSVKCRAYVD